MGKKNTRHIHVSDRPPGTAAYPTLSHVPRTPHGDTQDGFQGDQATNQTVFGLEAEPPIGLPPSSAAAASPAAMHGAGMWAGLGEKGSGAGQPVAFIFGRGRRAEKPGPVLPLVPTLRDDSADHFKWMECVCSLIPLVLLKQHYSGAGLTLSHAAGQAGGVSQGRTRIFILTRISGGRFC